VDIGNPGCALEHLVEFGLVKQLGELGFDGLLRRLAGTYKFDCHFFVSLEVDAWTVSK